MYIKQKNANVFIAGNDGRPLQGDEAVLLQHPCMINTPEDFEIAASLTGTYDLLNYQED